MRPPMHSAALQQNEGGKQQQQQQQLQQQQQQQQQQLESQLQQTVVPNTVDLTKQQQQQSQNNSTLQQHELLIENHLNFACSIETTATTSKLPTSRSSYQNIDQEQFVLNHRSNSDRLSFEEDDSIQLVDLSTSPPHATPLTNNSERFRGSSSITNRSSIASDCPYSRSSSSEDGSLSGDRFFHYSRANIFDDAAENFIINFPGDSSSTLHNQNDCILPLSETEPLLTNIEATVADAQRSICLSKNNASLVFTKKEISPHLRGSTTISNNNGTSQKILTKNLSNLSIVGKSSSSSSSSIGNNTQRRQHYHHHHHSFKISNDSSNRKQAKHLPATYHQQQRRSLQLNYNNNLVTTSTCSANNNYCCGSGSSTSKEGGIGSAVLHKHHSGLTSSVTPKTTTAAATRKQHAYSWYAPVYSALEEELEQDSRDSSPQHNLANTKKYHSNHYQQRRSSQNSSSAIDNETDALLETRNQINIQAQLQAQTKRDINNFQGKKLNSIAVAPNSLPLLNAHNTTLNGAGGGSGTGGGSGGGVGGVGGGGGDFSNIVTHNNYDSEGPHAASLGLAGGPLPRRRGFGNFFKTLVGGLRPSNGRSVNGNNGINGSNDFATTTTVTPPHRLRLPPSPEITITRTPSDQNVVLRDPAGRCNEKFSSGSIHGGSTSSLNVVQQKLWNILRRDGSAASLHQEKSQSIVQYKGLRKCETVLALTRQPNSLCSPVLGAGPGIVGGSCGNNGIRNHTGSGIFSTSGVEQIRPLNRLRNSVSSINATCSRCSSLLSMAATGSRYSLNIAANGSVTDFANTSSSVSQHLLRTPPPNHLEQPLNQRNLSTSNLNCSIKSQCNSDDLYEKTSSTNVHHSSGNCSRKSSAGANCSESTGSSISPPSNITTATFNSSITPPTITSIAHSFTPTAINDSQVNNDVKADIMHGFSVTTNPPLPPPTPSSTSCNSSSIFQNNPLTVTSLLSMSSNEERDLTDGISLPSIALNTSLEQQQQNQQHLETEPSSTTVSNVQPFQMFTCKLCLIDVETGSEATIILECGCHFCTECMKAYVEFEISEGAYEISCPDAQCPTQGALAINEIAKLTTANLMKKHHRYRLNREIELDKFRTWCPRAGCETICSVDPGPQNDSTPSTSTSTVHNAAISAVSPSGVTQVLCAVQCPSCRDEFCSACKKAWHPNTTCEENGRRLVADGQDDIGIPFDNDLIKCCPMCAVPIEKDEGCAQMMCKRCKHVFCWYCLASLDDDFLLRHYDKGPCKNKLGHSRASVVWHRAQVIGIFAGFGILLLVASPLLLLAAPCIICCKCRSCSGSKIDESDGDLDEATALQS